MHDVPSDYMDAALLAGEVASSSAAAVAGDCVTDSDSLLAVDSRKNVIAEERRFTGISGRFWWRFWWGFW